MAKRHENMPILKHFGANVRALRQQHGLTREALGERIGTDAKNIYRLESGTENLTLVRAERIAIALTTTLPDLIAPPQLPSWRAALADLGWHVESVKRDPPSRAVPVYDLQAAAGIGTDAPQPAVLGHVRPPHGQGRSATGTFLAQVIGDSMQPRIASGDWCQFALGQPKGAWLGAVVLVGERSADDLWAWTVKRVEQLTLGEHDAPQLVVRGTGPTQQARTLRLDDSGDVRVFATLVGVLGPAVAK